MRRIMSAVASSCFAFVQIGCARAPESASAEPTARAAAPKVTIDTAPIPARYDAGLPTTAAELRKWREGDPARAPASHVLDNIAAGAEKWMSRLVTAGAAVPAADAAEWASEWSELLQFADVTPAFCARARTIMSGPPGAARSAVSVPFARSCAAADDRSLILRADTPSWAVLSYFDPSRDFTKYELQPYDARLEQAARDWIANADVYDARAAAFILATQRSPEAEAALLEIHAEIEDRARADEVAFAFFETSNEAGRKLASAACKRKPREPMCDRGPQRDEELSASRKPSLDAVKARIDQLSAMGFAKVGNRAPAEYDSDDAATILMQAGHAYWFDVETGMYPNQHDSLLRHLAALIAPDLDEAIFEELPPQDDEESLPYELTAYAGGKRYRVMAENLGDWYDLNTVLHLLNTMMGDRNAAVRYAAVGTGDQTAIVVAAPPAAVRKAADAGLLEVADAGEAERVGKEFEEKVFEQLEEGTLPAPDE